MTVSQGAKAVKVTTVAQAATKVKTDCGSGGKGYEGEDGGAGIICLNAHGARWSTLTFESSWSSCMMRRRNHVEPHDVP